MLLVIGFSGEIIIDPDYIRVIENGYKQSFIALTISSGKEIRITPPISKEFADKLLQDLTDELSITVSTGQSKVVDYRKEDFSQYIVEEVD